MQSFQQRSQIAMAKASGVIGLRVSSRILGEMGKERPLFMNALINIADLKTIFCAE